MDSLRPRVWRGVTALDQSGKARRLVLEEPSFAGPAWAIEYLVQRARPFVFSTAAPPATAYALAESLCIIQAEPERRLRLHALSRYLRPRLGDARFAVEPGDSQIVPVLIGENDAALAVASALHGRFRCPRHPAANGARRNREVARCRSTRRSTRRCWIGLSRC